MTKINHTCIEHTFKSKKYSDNYRMVVIDDRSIELLSAVWHSSFHDGDTLALCCVGRGVLRTTTVRGLKELSMFNAVWHGTFYDRETLSCVVRARVCLS